jgi:aminoglycoside/choline kinase family phosphotransferase
LSLPPDLSTFVARRFGEDAVLHPLAGDASARRYFRVSTGEGTAVLALMAEPFDPPYVPFVNLAGFLAGMGIPVPAVREEHAEHRVLVLEDLGDRSLQAHLGAGAAPEDRRALYEEAVDWIVRLQRTGTPALTPAVAAYHYCLDDVKLGRELAYFREHHVDRLLGNPLSAAETATLDEGLARIAGEAGRSGDRVLCHRDYHSRNLMLPPRAGRAGRLAILDFQDARLGSRAYDLASLLCDPYVELPEDLRSAMVDRFLRGLDRRPGADAFHEHYAWVVAQRMLKAVGTFAGQATRFRNESYLRYIPPALARARESLASLEGMSPLSTLLADRLDRAAGG